MSCWSAELWLLLVRYVSKPHSHQSISHQPTVHSSEEKPHKQVFLRGRLHLPVEDPAHPHLLIHTHSHILLLSPRAHTNGSSPNPTGSRRPRPNLPHQQPIRQDVRPRIRPARQRLLPQRQRRMGLHLRRGLCDQRPLCRGQVLLATTQSLARRSG